MTQRQRAKRRAKMVRRRKAVRMTIAIVGCAALTAVFIGFLCRMDSCSTDETWATIAGFEMFAIPLGIVLGCVWGE